MRIAAVSLRDFRSHHRFGIEFGESATVLAGPNGSGKTNALEAVHFALTGRSCRTSSDRQVIAHGAEVARVELIIETDQGTRTMTAALDRSGNKELKVDGTVVERTDPGFERPLVTVFLPDRLSLVTGSPGGRRAHMDQLSSALRTTASTLRNDYNRALVQRNALVASARGGSGLSTSIDAWDAELARAGSLLASAREEAVASVREGAATIASQLGLKGDLAVSHRPGCELDQQAFLEHLHDQRDADVERGYTHYGPHRGDLVIKRDGRDMKTDSSQGEKRMALLALLLAEREAIAEARGRTPVLLLDDVMSELDSSRRGLLVGRVVGRGQCLITATEFEHVPGIPITDLRKISLGSGNDQGLRAA